MNLGKAVGWSVAVHIGFLVMQTPSRFVPPDDIRPIRVTYLPLNRPAAVVPAAVRQAARPPIVPVAASPVLPAPKPVPVAPPVSREAPPPLRPVSVSDVPTPPSSSISSLPEGEFAALQHKQRVRQHLRAHLNFPASWIQGTVRLRLILNPDGTLETASVLEASDPRLESAALEGAESAGQYPRFPKEMKNSSVRYDFLVQYRLDE